MPGRQACPGYDSHRFAIDSGRRQDTEIHAALYAINSYDDLEDHSAPDSPERESAWLVRRQKFVVCIFDLTHYKLLKMIVKN